MARIRTIKPEFWTNEKLCAQPEATHLLAAALLNYADDNGYFNANPALVKAACSPLREPSVSILESLQRLQTIGYLRLGRVPDGRRYGQIVEFSTHQKVSHPSKGRISKLSISWDDNPALKPDPLEILQSPLETLRPDQGNKGTREQGNKGSETTLQVVIPTVVETLTPVAQLSSAAPTGGGEKPKAVATIPTDAQEVFEHWRVTHNHPKAQLTDKRVALIRRALRAYSVADLCQALTGYRNSPHHMGANEQGVVFDDIELLLRDAGHIDRGLKFYTHPPRPQWRETAMDRIRAANPLAAPGGTNGPGSEEAVCLDGPRRDVRG